MSDALENSLKRISLAPEWAAVFQLYYQDHDGVFCRFRQPDAIPDKNDIFLRLNLFSPVLLEILLEDKTFKKVREKLDANFDISTHKGVVINNWNSRIGRL